MEISKRIKLIQVLGEIAIPLLGFYLWNWSYYFLMLFYLLDLIANTYFVYLKLHKIVQFQKKKHILSLIFIIKNVALLLGIIGIGSAFMISLYPNFDMLNESIRFLSIKELGISQWIFLFPLVFYAAYLQYKMNFLMPQKFRSANSNVIKNNYLRSLYLVLAGLGLGFAICIFYPIPESLVVWITIISISAYSYYYKPQFDNKS